MSFRDFYTTKWLDVATSHKTQFHKTHLLPPLPFQHHPSAALAHRRLGPVLLRPLLVLLGPFVLVVGLNVKVVGGLLLAGLIVLAS